MNERRAPEEGTPGHYLPDLKLSALDDARLHELNNDTSRLRIVSLFDRPGTLEVDQALCELFPIETGKLRGMMLPWEGCLWWIMSVPLEDRGKVEAVLQRMGWRLNDGVPHLVELDDKTRMIFPERPQRIHKYAVTVLATFPINSRRTFMLEQIRPDSSDPDSFTPCMLAWGVSQEAAERECLEIGALIERHLAREGARGN